VQRMIQHIPLELVNKIISMVPQTSVNGTKLQMWFFGTMLRMSCSLQNQLLSYSRIWVKDGTRDL